MTMEVVVEIALVRALVMEKVVIRGLMPKQAQQRLRKQERQGLLM
jgi:hypothetical protein